MTGRERAEAALTYDQAVAMLPDGEQVHAFVNPAGMLVGADWDRAEILALLRTGRPELSGDMATEMGHGIVAFREDDSYVFIATRPTEAEAAATLAATGLATPPLPVRSSFNTFPPTGAELARPHTADVAEFGRANLAGIPTVRTYTCEACGAAGTEPTHAPYCDKIHAARLWASVAAAGARDVIAAYPARLKAAIEAGDHDNEPFVLLGELAWSLRSLLAEIDKAAGA